MPATETPEHTAEVAELKDRLQRQEEVIAEQARQIEATSAVATRANRSRSLGAVKAREIRDAALELVALLETPS